MIKLIVGTIILIALIGLILVIACTLNSINHVKCPKCGCDMQEIGIVTPQGHLWGRYKFEYELLSKQFPHYKRIYQCPKCGTTKII